MKIDLQYDLVNYTPASAAPPEANFDRIEQHINQELIERDGTVAMRAQLQLVGDPVSALDATPKQYVDQVLPIGIMMMFGGATTPPGGRWALCNGAELSSAAYPALFAVIANNYSPAGTPAGRFHLPNLNGRFPYGGTPGASGGSADAVVVAHDHTINHDHADAGTGDANQNHTHVDDHNHAGTTATANLNHLHNIPHGMELMYYGGASGEWQLRAGDGVTLWAGRRTWSEDGAAHQHDVAVNFKSEYGYGASTGGQSNTHQHAVDIPTYNGSSGSTGVVGTNANLPPYVAVTYIMRVS